jgi:hypothetical protein
MPADEDRSQLVKVLKASVTDFFDEILTQLTKYTKKTFSDDDPWLHTIIEDLPPGENIDFSNLTKKLEVKIKETL